MAQTRGPDQPGGNTKKGTTMPTVATYYQLLDAETNLELNGTDRMTFHESVPVAPASGEGAVVTWVARRKGNGSVTYTVELNSYLLNTYTVSSGERVTIMETTDTNHVSQGDNDLVFTVTGGTGTLGLGDVLLWHRLIV